MQAQDPRAARFKQAVFDADAARLRSLFDEHPELVEVIDEPWFHFGKPAIVQAGSECAREVVDVLLEHGADIDARSDWENGPYSALHGLVDGPTREKLAFAEYLVERGATIDLHAAAGLGRTDVIERILAAEPNRVSEPGPDGATPLHLARDVETAELLLEHGAEIDKRCVDHRSTPAMWATQAREDVMRFLVGRGARPDLYIAVLLDDVDLCARILEDEPDAIDVRVRFGHSHAHLGGGDKYVWALEGAETPIELARRRDRPKTYAHLLERSAPSVRLVEAAHRGDTAELERMLAADPDLLSGLEPRRICDALCGTPEAARVLLAHGADPDARDDRAGGTALHHAAWRGLTDLARVLLDAGADPTLRDRHYDATPLGWAIEGGQAETAALLAERHPPDVVEAARMGDVDRVRALLDADPSLVNGLEEGRISPLRSAAWSGRVEVVRLLLERGADPTIANPKSGHTALDFARERGHTEIVALLDTLA